MNLSATSGRSPGAHSRKLEEPPTAPPDSKWARLARCLRKDSLFVSFAVRQSWVGSASNGVEGAMPRFSAKAFPVVYVVKTLAEVWAGEEEEKVKVAAAEVLVKMAVAEVLVKAFLYQAVDGNAPHAKRRHRGGERYQLILLPTPSTGRREGGETGPGDASSRCRLPRYIVRRETGEACDQHAHLPLPSTIIQCQKAVDEKFETYIYIKPRPFVTPPPKNSGRAPDVIGKQDGGCQRRCGCCARLCASELYAIQPLSTS